jgi:hypothetical protein
MVKRLNIDNIFAAKLKNIFWILYVYFSQIEIPPVKLPYLRGWVYGAVCNDSEKIHPLLVPFEELPQEQKSKDRDAYETLFNLYENNMAK